MKYLLALTFFICSCKNESTAVVSSVWDGDTYRLQNGDRVRLAEADCNELKQDKYGYEAKAYAEKLLLGKTVTLVYVGISYNRKVAVVSISGVSVAELLVERGLAHVSESFCRNEALIAKYRYAKSHKIGLFSKPYILPYQFRKQKH